MPYIGNSNNNVGEHVNNFKVLDDISSFTATFDGSSASVVSTANETIKVLKHRFEIQIMFFYEVFSTY